MIGTLAHDWYVIAFGTVGVGTLPRLQSLIIFPAKAREYVLTGVGLCVCLCVSVTTITIMDGFVPNFMGRFIGEKGSSCFVTIGRGM